MAKSPKPATRDTTPPPVPEPDANGAAKKYPVFKVGPIPTDANNSVEACVWDQQVTTNDGREFTVHNVTVQGNWRGEDGVWKHNARFLGSQVYAVVYCLQRCSDWILAQRDSQNAPDAG